MGLSIEQRLSLDAPPERVWAVLTDARQVASCLPGAAVTEQVDERTYRGTITIKVGPVTTSYRGTIRFERLDPATWEAELVGQGQDVRGKGGAEMRMQSRLHPRDGGTDVTVVSEVSISGLLAQMGRGMIESVSAQIFQQFAAALQAKLAAGPDAPAAGAEAKPVDALSLGVKAVGDAVGRGVRRVLGGGGEKA